MKMHWREREFVKLREACEILCESVRTFWRRVAANVYPRPLKNGRNCTVRVDWLAAEVERRKQGEGR